jgi:hypothetical protein
MFDLNLILERLTQLAERGNYKIEEIADQLIGNISDNELIEIIKIAEMIFEKNPETMSDIEKANCYLYGELLIMFLMIEKQDFTLEIQDFKQEEWTELVNKFTDKLCVDYAERMKYVEVVIVNYFPKKFKIQVTNKGQNYLNSLNTKRDLNFIDKRLGVQLIYINAMNSQPL